MRYLLQVLGKTLLIVGGLFVLIVIGAVFFLRTAQFRDLLHEQLVSTLNTSLPAEVSLGSIEGSMWADFQLSDFVVHYEGEEILRIPQLTVEYGLRSLLSGQVHIARIEVSEPTVRLAQDTQGNWNLVKAFVPDPVEKTGTEEDEAVGDIGISVLLSALHVRQATIEIVLAGQEDNRPYRLTQIDLDAHAALDGDRIAATLDYFSAQLDASPLPPLTVRVSTTLQVVFQDVENVISLTIPDVSIISEQSQLRFAGQVKDLKTMADGTIDGTLSIQKLAAAELAAVVPGWPVKEDVSGEIQLSGRLADLRTDVTLALGEAELGVHAQADLSQDSPTYAGKVTFSRFDAASLLGDDTFAGVLEGSLEVSGKGTDLAVLVGKADLHVQALRLGEWLVGNIELNGSIKQQLGEIHGSIAAGAGQARWDGKVDLRQEPSYELSLSVEHLDFKKVAAQTDNATGLAIMTSDLNLSGNVRGQGIDLSTLNGHVVFDIAPSSVGPVHIQEGRLDATVADGKIHISEVTLNAQDAALSIQGKLGTTLEQAGNLVYRLHVGDFAPWLALVDQHGSGQFTLSGEATGNLADLHVSGKLQAKAIALEGLALKKAVVEYDLAKIGQGWPKGTLHADLHDLDAGIALQSVDVEAHFLDLLDLNQEQSPGMRLSVSVQDADARQHRLKAEVVQKPDHVAVVLDTLVVALPDGIWTLAQPASIVQQQKVRQEIRQEIHVDAFRLVNGDQHIELNGTISTTGVQDFHLQIDALALAELESLLPQTPEISGFLSANLQLSGTARAPLLNGNVNIAALHVAKQPYKGLTAALAYQDEHATLDLAFQQDDQHSLQIQGGLPLSVSWADGLATQILGDVNVRAYSTGLSLAFLNALSGEEVKDIAGELSLDMTLSGPVDHLVPQGTVQLRNGQVAVASLGTTISDITVGLATDAQAIRIENIAAQSGKGRIRGHGKIDLHNHKPQGIAFSLTADQWPIIQTRQYKVQIGAALDVQGTLSAPHVSGGVDVLKATLRPDLAFLDEKSVKPDETIVVIPVGETLSSASTQEAQKGITPEQTSSEETAGQNATLDLAVRIHPNTRIKHPNASIELAGQVRITQTQGAEARLIGAIEVVRGWAGFQGRRFALNQGKIRFIGGKRINPSLDIVAQYQTPDYLVEAVVAGTAEEPSLVLQSQPELEQADILAVLLFGRPAHALGQGEKLDLQEQALAITEGYAAEKIGKSVSQALGLEKLGVSLQDLDISGGGIGFGRYLTKGLHVSVAQDLTKKGGRKVSMQYQLSPDWQVDTSTSSGGSSEAHISWQKKY